jgi:hypothetical protein
MPRELNDPFAEFTRVDRSLVRMTASVLVVLCMAACATTFPMEKGHALSFARSDRASAIRREGNGPYRLQTSVTREANDMLIENPMFVGVKARGGHLGGHGHADRVAHALA